MSDSEVNDSTAGADDGADEQTLIQRAIEELLQSSDHDSITMSVVKGHLKKTFGKKTTKKYKQFIKDTVTEIVSRHYEENQPEEEEKEENEEPDDQLDAYDEVMQDAAADDYYDEEDDDDYAAPVQKKKKKKEKKKKRKNRDDGASRRNKYTGRVIKGAQTAYFLFQADARPTLKAEQPDLKVGQVAKLLGERWREMSTEDKDFWKQKAIEDRNRYDEEVLEFERTDPDGFAEWLEWKNSKKKKKGGDRAEPAPKKRKAPRYNKHDEAIESEEVHWFDQLNKDLKKGNRSRKKDEQDLHEIKETMMFFLKKMDHAHEKDINSNWNRQPALAKLEMLPEVNVQVSKRMLQPTLLDCGLLTTLRQWLEPLPADQALPNQTLRKSVYRILTNLNDVAEVHLENSDIAKRLVQLWRVETKENKPVVKALIQRWMRLIQGASANYKKLAQVEAEQAAIIERRAAEIKANNVELYKSHIPKQIKFDYVHRPSSRIDPLDHDEAMEVRVKKRNGEESAKQRLVRAILGKKRRR